MRASLFSLLVLGVVAAGCEPEGQSLPFSPDGAEPVTKTVGPGGAVLSTAAGASVAIPAGALGGSSTVSIAHVSAPAAVQRSGAAVSRAFQVEPAGTSLRERAAVELKFDAAAAGQDAWLASVVNVTPTGTEELGNTRVDLATGIAESRISRFGTLAVVVPEASAVFRVRRGGARAESPVKAALAPNDGVADSVAVDCGEAGNRCSDLVINASQNLLDKVEDAAAIYPVIEGVLRISGGTATGRISLSTSLRAELQSGQSAENVEINAEIEPTASTVVTETATRITLTHIRQRVGGSADSGSGSETFTGPLEIEKSGGRGVIAVTRDFQISNAADQLEDASVTIEFSVDIHQ